MRQKCDEDDNMVQKLDVVLPEGSSEKYSAEARDNPLKDADKCVIANRMLYDEAEDLENIVDRLTASLEGLAVKPVKCVRLKKGERKNPLVKMAFDSLQDRIGSLYSRRSFL